MSKIQHLLVATDGSEGSIHAAAFGGDLARALNAKVTILFVQSEDSIMPNAWGVGHEPRKPVYSMPIEEVRTMLERRARERELKKTGEAVGDLADPPEQKHVWGRAAEQICAFARDEDVDMIVIGSHGRSGISRALLGSVSNAVANQAPCPVTIVR